MATTPNFGWTTPNDTDYVKDGASAIRTLGNAIDASMADLEGGTTGQVLSKNTNADMDFVWITPNDADAIQNTIVDAKGDVITATAADTPARLAVGTDGQVLTADSTTATGLKWAAAAAGGMTLIATATPSGASSLAFTSIPTTYKQLLVTWSGVYQSSANTAYWRLRINNDSGSNYYYMGAQFDDGTGTWVGDGSGSNTAFGANIKNAPIPATDTSNSSVASSGYFRIDNANSTTAMKTVSWSSAGWRDSNAIRLMMLMHGRWQDTANAVTSLDFIRNSTQTITGTFYLWGIS